MRWAAGGIALAAIVVAALVEPRLFGALAIGAAILVVGVAMLRSMAADRETAPPEPQVVSDPRERTSYRCELCGTEVVLVVRGEDIPPRHCGERMRTRTEIPRH